MNRYNDSMALYNLALSPTAVSAGGSSNPVDLGKLGGGQATLFAMAADGEATLQVERSSASDGTFAPFGASMVVPASSLGVRSFKLNGSATWYRVTYDSAGTTLAAMLKAGGAGRSPQTNPSDVSVFSEVA